MSKLEKIFFWCGLVIIVIDDIYWQWTIKLSKDPLFGGEVFASWSMICDILFLVAWLYVLVRIYKKANQNISE